MQKMKQRMLIFIYVLFLVGVMAQPVEAKEFEENLYAQSAVLMDADTGRVLYGKEERKIRPMASTTKVMTCILALESADGNEIVEVSSRAAAQPDVQLNMQKGEQYYLKDLLYSLMLKSHNDTAVAIAECVGGSVEGFAEMMNEKAAQIGCTQTHFVTPNGLDAEDEGGIHATTARDLALIMRYAIQNQEFLMITQTTDYNFSDLSGKRTFVLHNTNALLGNMEGILSGKTGFTVGAGYCYVCAVKREDRTFVITLLASGWPSHKNYKYEDTAKLVNYAFDQYHYYEIWKETQVGAVEIRDGIPISDRLFETAYANVEVIGAKEKRRRILLREDEQIKIREDLKKNLCAPVQKGDVVGNIVYTLDGDVVCRYPIVLKDSIRKKNFWWYYKKTWSCYFLKHESSFK